MATQDRRRKMKLDPGEVAVVEKLRALRREIGFDEATDSLAYRVLVTKARVVADDEGVEPQGLGFRTAHATLVAPGAGETLADLFAHALGQVCRQIGALEVDISAEAVDLGTGAMAPDVDEAEERRLHQASLDGWKKSRH